MMFRRFIGATLAVAFLFPVGFDAQQQRERRRREPPSPETRASLRDFSLDRIGRKNTRVRLAGARIRINFTEAPTDGEDFANLASVGAGAVVTFSRAPAIKLRTAVDLRFGAVTLPTENVAPDYPGVYGLWLKNRGDGWVLAFTNEPDVWGTQYLPEAEVALVPLSHSDVASDDDPDVFIVELLSLDAGTETNGELVMRWGPHRWSTPFSVTP